MHGVNPRAPSCSITFCSSCCESLLHAWLHLGARFALTTAHICFRTLTIAVVDPRSLTDPKSTIRGLVVPASTLHDTDLISEAIAAAPATPFSTPQRHSISESHQTPREKFASTQEAKGAGRLTQHTSKDRTSSWCTTTRLRGEPRHRDPQASSTSPTSCSSESWPTSTD